MFARQFAGQFAGQFCKARYYWNTDRVAGATSVLILCAYILTRINIEMQLD